MVDAEVDADGVTPSPRGLFGDEPHGLARVIDCRRLGSPWSTAKVAATLPSVPAGEVLEILSLDPADLDDIAAWCQANGERLLSAHSLRGTYVIRVERWEHPSLARAR
jgi:TusA-related sulfurtransferase